MEAEASKATEVQLASGRADPTATGRCCGGTGRGGISRATGRPSSPKSAIVTSFGVSVPPRSVMAAVPPGASKVASRHSSWPDAGSRCSPKVETRKISPSAPSKLCRVSGAPSGASKRTSVGSPPSRQRTVGCQAKSRASGDGSERSGDRLASTVKALPMSPAPAITSSRKYARPSICSPSAAAMGASVTQASSLGLAGSKLRSARTRPPAKLA